MQLEDKIDAARVMDQNNEISSRSRLNVLDQQAQQAHLQNDHAPQLTERPMLLLKLKDSITSDKLSGE